MFEIQFHQGILISGSLLRTLYFRCRQFNAILIEEGWDMHSLSSQSESIVAGRWC